MSVTFNPFKKWDTASGDCCHPDFFTQYDPAFLWWRHDDGLGVIAPCPGYWRVDLSATADIDEVYLSAGGTTITAYPGAGTFSWDNDGSDATDRAMRASFRGGWSLGLEVYLASAGTWSATFGPRRCIAFSGLSKPDAQTKSGLASGGTLSFNVDAKGVITHTP